MNSLNKIIITGVDNELSINLALSTNRNLKDMVFGISSSYSSVLVTSFSIGTEKIIYYLQRYKNFCFHIIFLRFMSFFLLQKNEGNLDKKNHRNVFSLFLFEMLIVFLLQDNIILLCLKLLKELFFTISTIF